MIYFAQAQGTDRVKIGYADDVSARLPGIATGCPFPLELIRVIEGSPAVERWLHRHFAARRVHREWFLFCDEMLTVEPPHIVLPSLSEAAAQTWQFIEEQAAAMGATEAARRKWRTRGVPYRWQLRLLDVASKARKNLDRSAFERMPKAADAEHESAA